MSDKKDQDIQILKEIHKNAIMGVDAISFLEPDVKHDSLMSDIKTQMNVLSDIERQARQELESRGEVPQANNAKVGMWVSTKMHVLKDRSPSHISQMLIEGNNMGIIDLTRALNNNPLADTHLKDTAQRLLEAEQQSIDTMKQYL